MTESNDSRAKHREHIQKRTDYVRAKRGPVSFVWGNHVVNPRQRVPGAPGLWSPLLEGEAGLLVEATAPRYALPSYSPTPGRLSLILIDALKGAYEWRRTICPSKA